MVHILLKVVLCCWWSPWPCHGDTSSDRALHRWVVGLEVETPVHCVSFLQTTMSTLLSSFLHRKMPRKGTVLSAFCSIAKMVVSWTLLKGRSYSTVPFLRMQNKVFNYLYISSNFLKRYFKTPFAFSGRPGKLQLNKLHLNKIQLVRHQICHKAEHKWDSLFPQYLSKIERRWQPEYHHL